MTPPRARHRLYAYACQGGFRITAERYVRFFRNGRNQTLRIPREFELDAEEAIIRREDDRLVIEPVRKKGLLAILAAIEVRPFDTPADHEYARLRLHLEQAGTPIGPNDMLIAAHALATKSILVTANKSEITRIPGLTVENWLEVPTKV